MEAATPSKEIREFPAVSTPASNDKLLVQQTADNVTRYLTPDQVLNLIATISQAEAEAGTATTRRIFTAERVKQAITAHAPAAVKLPVLAKTANYTVTTSDIRKVIDATTGTWTLTLPPASSAGDGFWIGVRNSGTGVITIDPDAAELIDGAATITLVAGQSALVVCNGAAWKTVGLVPVVALPLDALPGCKLSNNAGDATNDIDIAAGARRDADDTENMVLAAALTKQLDAAWAVGTNAGGLDTGAVANGTYHVWLIKRVDTGVVDVLFSLSATAPTMPSGYTKKRRLGTILRESAAIVAFNQDGTRFIRETSVQDISTAPSSSAAVTRTLASMPTGVKYRWIGTLIVFGTSVTVGGLLSDLEGVDETVSATHNQAVSPNVSGVQTFGASGDLAIVTNANAQVRSRLSTADATANIVLRTRGWDDYRLREGA